MENEREASCSLDDLRVGVATTCYLDERRAVGDFIDERAIWVDTHMDKPYWCAVCDAYFERPEDALQHVGIYGKAPA